jgi:hypothetical protein
MTLYVDINEQVDSGLADPKIRGGKSQDSGLDLWDQVVKVGEGWVQLKL